MSYDHPATNSNHPTRSVDFGPGLAQGTTAGLVLVVFTLVLAAGPAQADWFAAADEAVMEKTLNHDVDEDDQCHASVAIDSLGNATTPWESVVGAQRDNIFSITLRSGLFYDFDGDPEEPNDFENPVASNAEDDQRHPDAVTSREVQNNDDRSIIAWSSGSDVDHEFDTYVRVFDASDGTPNLTGDHKANGSTLSMRRTWPDVAVVRCGFGTFPACGDAANGDFVVVWGRSIGGTIPPTAQVMARAYNGDGTPRSDPLLLGDSFNLPTSPPHQVLPDVAVRANGTAVAIWVDVDEDGNPETVLRYCEFTPFGTNPAGCSAGQTALVAPAVPELGQTRPSIDVTNGGDIVVAWTEWPMGNQVESQASAWFWRLPSMASIGDGPFHVDWDPQDPPVLGHHRAVVRFVNDNAAHLVMAWTFDAFGSDGDILGREVCMLGGAPDPLGPGVATLNSTTSGDQLRPALDYSFVDVLSGTRIWVTWESLDAGPGGSTNAWDIRGRAWDPASSACVAP